MSLWGIVLRQLWLPHLQPCLGCRETTSYFLAETAPEVCYPESLHESSVGKSLWVCGKHMMDLIAPNSKCGYKTCCGLSMLSPPEMMVKSSNLVGGVLLNHRWTPSLRMNELRPDFWWLVNSSIFACEIIIFVEEIPMFSWSPPKKIGGWNIPNSSVASFHFIPLPLEAPPPKRRKLWATGAAKWPRAQPEADANWLK